MTEYNFEERYNRSDHLASANLVTDSMLDNPDHFADQVPMDVALVHDTAMDGNVAAIGPMSAPFVENEPVIYETAPILTTTVGTIAEELPSSPTIPYATTASASEPIIPQEPVELNVNSLAALINPEDSEHFRTRWNEIQGKFVDEPRSAVQQADGLVSEVIGQITEMFAHEHGTLESQWNQGGDVSTEDLRKALQRYRSFFNRLVLPRAE
jgi:hypothetical protein